MASKMLEAKKKRRPLMNRKVMSIILAAALLVRMATAIFSAQTAYTQLLPQVTTQLKEAHYQSPSAKASVQEAV